VFFLNRKAKAEFHSTQQKDEYKNVFLRCYGLQQVILALCSSQKFIGYNFDYGSQIHETRPFVEDSFQMHGVLHEFSEGERHVPCEVEIYESEGGDETIGSLVMTTTNVGRDETRIKEENLDLVVLVKLYVTSQLRLQLFDGIRDAALSGSSFMHVELGCQKPTDEDVNIAMSEMREHRYGPVRKIRQLKMWPKIELRNSPKWARHKD
jgi:hypothetical protein